MVSHNFHCFGFKIAHSASELNSVRVIMRSKNLVPLSEVGDCNASQDVIMNLDSQSYRVCLSLQQLQLIVAESASENTLLSS